jgi:hypothetical protein
MTSEILYLDSTNHDNNLKDAIWNICIPMGYALITPEGFQNFFDIEFITKTIKSVALLIADVSDSKNDFAIGQAFALNKPILFIADGRNDHNSYYSKFLIKIYDSNNLNKFSTEFSNLFHSIILSIQSENTNISTSKRKVNKKIFISYCHKDSEYLERLLIHLKPLLKQELITLWVDTYLRSGDKWKSEIEKALSSSEACILLLSADFLASDFIINNELPPLLRNAEEKGSRIIPVILKPCRFSRDNALNIFQAANDPLKPMCSLNDDEREKIYDKISFEVEKLLTST